MTTEPDWLKYAKKIQAIAQAGLAYSKDKFDIERFQQLLEISAEIFSRHTNIGRQTVIDIFQKESGYPTPKIDVRAVVFQDEKILLVREKIDGKWALPGGWADSHLSIRENLIKEAKEEAGATIKPLKIIAIHDRKKHNQPPLPHGVYKIFVLCELLKFEFKANIETAEAGFFDREKLPDLSLGRNSIEQIEICFNAKAGDPVIFD